MAVYDDGPARPPPRPHHLPPTVHEDRTQTCTDAALRAPTQNVPGGIRPSSRRAKFIPSWERPLGTVRVASRAVVPKTMTRCGFDYVPTTGQSASARVSARSAQVCVRSCALGPHDHAYAGGRALPISPTSICLSIMVARACRMDLTGSDAAARPWDQLAAHAVRANPRPVFSPADPAWT